MEKSQPLISIIIPCYNSGKFIESTIEMLLEQSLSECELILINDGSTDDTLQILKQYESYGVIRFVNQSNQGVSIARNEGIRIAKGKYIYFLDSDDTLADDTLSHFKNVLTAYPNCQMYAFGYETKMGGKTGKHYIFPQYNDQIFSGQEILKRFLSKKFCIHICSGIYERQFLLEHKLNFKSGVKIGEDILFILQSLQQANQIYYSKRLTFIYQIRGDSAMQGYSSYSKEQYCSHTLLREYLLPIADNDKTIRNTIYFFLLFSYLSNLRYYLRSDLKDKDLNDKFIKDGNIRYKSNFTNNLRVWLLMKISVFIPLRLILYIMKR